MSDTHAAEAPEKVVAPVESDVETKARRLGWVSKDEFKGDPDRHRSAEEFLERGERILPIVLKDNERLHSRLGEVENVLKETREASKELLAFTSKSEERAYQRAKTEIEDRIAKAAEAADPNAVRGGMRELDALAKDHAKPAPEIKPEAKPAVASDPVIQDWIGKEDWFRNSKALNAYAVDVFGELERDKPGLSKSELLAETKRRTMDKFPEKFGINPEREKAAAVANPTGGKTPKRGKVYDDLPAEAKQACDKFVRTIPGYTREKYVKDYDWDN